MLFRMTLTGILVVSFLPLALAGLARARSGRLSEAVVAALSGLLAVVAAAVGETLLDPLFAGLGGLPRPLVAAIDAFLRIALVEEGAKLLGVALVVLAFGPRDARGGRGCRDEGFVCPERTALAVALLVSLSFAAFENLYYGLRAPGSLTARSLLALPVHASLAMVASRSLTRGFRHGRYLALAAILHGAFDLALGAGYPAVFAAFFLVPVLALVAVDLWLKSGSSDGADGSDAADMADRAGKKR